MTTLCPFSGWAKIPTRACFQRQLKLHLSYYSILVRAFHIQYKISTSEHLSVQSFQKVLESHHLTFIHQSIARCCKCSPNCVILCLLIIQRLSIPAPTQPLLTRIVLARTSTASTAAKSGETCASGESSSLTNSLHLVASVCIKVHLSGAILSTPTPILSI